MLGEIIGCMRHDLVTEIEKYTNMKTADSGLTVIKIILILTAAVLNPCYFCSRKQFTDPKVVLFDVVSTQNISPLFVLTTTKEELVTSE